ncbi:MAG: MBL fold metallo-hydrolase [Fervidobacterium sp.]|uniref:Glyoxylase, beta-lactamase superfamily II n=1 Tax=Fervidobacterium gondwanense DSM 13020 TaxID=1121883 RepID=A0A1M7T9Q8_FERGO|nr:MBL fold metallo-hydrolase [Fervidobacterium gondwanense]UXF01031.1 beta-lactamase [Fervidobacterium riparium]SHN67458.1 Glyoxylase, beta-lactamase superfamily II [Fervidobacterium gondwanense DSM 13020]
MKLSISELKVYKTSGEFETNTYVFTIDDITYVVDPGIGVGKYLGGVKCDVILTHGHYDHIAGLSELKHERIYISPEDSKALSDPSVNLSVLFDEPFSLDVNWYNVDEYFNTLFAPGHTNGSRIILFDGVIFTGDVVFSNSIGRVDLYIDEHDKVKMREEMKKTIYSLRKFLKTLPQDWYICPGHGEMVTIKRLFEINPFFK